MKNASNGTNAVNASTGRISYTPNPGFVGRDTIRYEVCVTGEPTNCAEANQIIVVNSASTSNVTIASDDFNVTDQEVAVTGNVSDNDMDPEGDNQSVTPVSYSVAAGDIDILSDGSYTFTPANGFYGPVEFIYETTDDNASPVSVNATLHLLVIRDLTVQVRLYLEGALINNANAQGSTHSRPLMRDQLRTSPFTGSNYIPEEDPYTTNAYKVPTIDDYYTHVGPGLVTELTTVSDAGTIFGVTGEDAVVDWVFVELRSKSDSTTVLATRAGLVQRDGDVIDVDGDLGLRFPGVAADDYYVSVRHRNHFGAMTAASKTPAQLFDLIDFTQVSTGIYDMGTECKGIYDYTGLAQNPYIKTGYLALWGGDFNGDGLIKFINPNDDLNTLVGNVFGYEYEAGGTTQINFYSNFDFAFGYQEGDFDMNSKAKQDNPNDDTNFLYSQILFYPLNTGFRSNFDGFIEQLPQLPAADKYRCD